MIGWSNFVSANRTFADLNLDVSTASDTGLSTHVPERGPVLGLAPTARVAS